MPPPPPPPEGVHGPPSPIGNRRGKDNKNNKLVGRVLPNKGSTTPPTPKGVHR